MPTFIGKMDDALFERAGAADMAVCTQHDSVPVGMCLMYVKGTLTYMGPIHGSPPPPAGCLTVMSPADLKSFADYCDKQRH